MLRLKESLSSTDVHIFELKTIGLDDNISFELLSDTYPEVNIKFTLEYKRLKIPSGYSVSVHLFKNKHFSQKDIVDLRVSEYKSNKGRIGYLFRLDALFEKDVLDLNEHIYPYAYYAIEYILSSTSNLQTKEVLITSDKFRITDFFDEDTIILVLCNEYCAEIPNFQVSNYLVPLFLNGFISFDNSTNITSFNNTLIIRDTYDAVKNIKRPDGTFIMRVTTPNVLLISETFISYLFQKLLQQKNETTTRFITLYQIIEISISKIFHLKVQSKVCNNLNNLTSEKLKEFLSEIQREKYRITSLLNEYSRPSIPLETQLKDAVIDFFIHVQDSDYADMSKHADLTLATVFYDYRNKIVHNYRLIHAQGIDNLITETKMQKINDLTEVLISEIIYNFKIV